jgi:hypothetical protein
MTVAMISDALTRIGSIQQQLQSLQSGTLLDSLGVTGDGSSTTSTTDSTDFADQLAAAQDTTGSDEEATSASDAIDSADATDPTDATDATDATDTDSTGAGSTDTSQLLSLLQSALGSGTTASSLVSGGSGVALSSSASSQLTSGQQQFASTLSAETGLNPNVVSAWMLSEESGGAAQSRQSANNNDWLNIGYTDSATYGSSDSVWSDPTSAANATAAWLKGESSISGYGTASSGIQSILSSVGQTPAAQIQAIQNSGWSSSGYPNLESTYGEVVG